MSQQGMSAYQPECEIAQPPALPRKQSKIPQVLGMIHLCIGGLSLLSSGTSLLQGKRMSDEAAAQFALVGDDMINLPAELVEKLALIDGSVQLSGYLDLLVSLLLVIAGIGLLKYQRWGRTTTNAYVTVSLGAKVFSAYTWCVLATPFFESFIKANPDFEMIGVNAFRGAMLVSILLSSVYALVCLFLVNREVVKESLN